MLSVIMVLVLVSMSMVLIRVVIGPSLFDKLLGMNSFSSNVVVFIVLLGMFNNTNAFIDIAIIYALVSFITITAFLMYFKYKPDK